MKNGLFKRGYLSKLVLAMSMLMTFGLTSGAWANEAQLWSKIKSGGHIVLMRHALAPGFGDPDGFTLGDCSSQRVLSEVGRHRLHILASAFVPMELPKQVCTPALGVAALIRLSCLT